MPEKDKLDWLPQVDDTDMQFVYVIRVCVCVFDLSLFS